MTDNICSKYKKIIKVTIILVLLFIMSSCNNAGKEQIKYTYVLANSKICFIHPIDLLDDTYNQAIEYIKKGIFYKAEHILEATLEQQEEVSNIDLLTKGKILNALGVCDLALYKIDSAADRFRYALELISSETGENSSDTAAVLNNLGATLIEQRGDNEAIDLLIKAQSRVSNLGEMDKSCVNINYAFTFIFHNETETGIKIYKEEFKKVNKNSENGKLIYAFIKGNLASFDSKELGDETTKQYLNEALTVYKEILGEDHLELSRLYIINGDYHIKLGNYDQALKLIEKALKIQENPLNCNPALIALGYDNLGFIYSKKNDINNTIKYYQKALEINKNYDEYYSSTGSLYNNIGLCYAQKGEFDIALNYFLKAYFLIEDDSSSYLQSQICRDNIRYSYIELKMDPYQFSEWLEQQRDVEIVLPKAS